MCNFIRIAIVLITVPYSLLAGSFYVRPNGNNDNDGQSDTNAWASIEKVREYAWNKGFAPGDSILFKGGETHTTNQALYMQGDRCSGTEANPLYLGSYGSGRARIEANGDDFISIWIPDAGTAAGAIRFALEVENLNIIGNGIAKNGPANCHGIFIWNSSESEIEFLHIANCDISGFAGDGVAVGRDDKSKGRFNQVTVRHVKAFDNPGAGGVSPHSGSGISIAGADGALIEYCLAYNNGINNNNPGGPIGIWFWDCINSTIQFCESYNNRTTKGDGGGFDLDGGCESCIIQYSYSHGNAGAGFLLAQFGGAFAGYGPLENNTIRYNISVNDGRKGSFGGISFWGANSTDFVGTTDIYNNTISMGGTPDNGSPSCVRFLGGNGKGIKLFNNIFVASNGLRIVNSDSRFDTSKVHFQNNCYWSMNESEFAIKWGPLTCSRIQDWRDADQEILSGTPVGFQVNPAFTSSGSGETIGDPMLLRSLTCYKLSQSSLMRDAGVNITEVFGISPGKHDFWGTSLPQNTTYDIGAHEHEIPTRAMNYSNGKPPNVARIEQGNAVFNLIGQRFETIPLISSFCLSVSHGKKEIVPLEHRQHLFVDHQP